MNSSILLFPLVVALTGGPSAPEPDLVLANRGPGLPPEVLWVSARTLEDSQRAGESAPAVGPMSAESLARKLRLAKAAFSGEGCTGVPMGDVIGGPSQEPAPAEVTLARAPISFIGSVQRREIGWEPIPEYGRLGLVAARLEVRVIEVLRDETGTLREGAAFTMLQNGGSFELDSVRFCTRDPTAQEVSAGDTLFATATVSDIHSPYLPSPPQFLVKGGLLMPVGGDGRPVETISLEKVRELIAGSPNR